MSTRVRELLDRLEQSRVTITVRRNLVDELRQLVGEAPQPMHALDAELVEIAREIRAAAAVELAASTRADGMAAELRLRVHEQLVGLEQRLCDVAKRSRSSGT